ncbi:AP-4 complex subunit epsilon [Linum grandiflorum]
MTALMKIYAFAMAAGRKVDVLPECETLIEELSASHSSDLQQREYELQAVLALDANAIKNIMPSDASCREIEDRLLDSISVVLAKSHYAQARQVVPVGRGGTTNAAQQISDLRGRSGLVEKLLIAAVADADVNVRHSIFSPLYENFLAQADCLSAVYAALNDEPLVSAASAKCTAQQMQPEEAQHDFIRASVGISSRGKLLVPKLVHCFAKSFVEDSNLAPPTTTAPSRLHQHQQPPAPISPNSATDKTSTRAKLRSESDPNSSFSLHLDGIGKREG